MSAATAATSFSALANLGTIPADVHQSLICVTGYCCGICAAACLFVNRVGNGEESPGTDRLPRCHPAPPLISLIPLRLLQMIATAY